MSGTTGPDPERNFEEKWREWSRRPPRKSAAFAAAEVKRELRGHRAPVHRWRVPAAAAAVAVCGYIGVRLLNPPAPAPVPPPAVVTVPAAAPLNDGQVLIWLDSETPLYMTYQETPGGSR
jgi:hypothetical protein